MAKNFSKVAEWGFSSDAVQPHVGVLQQSWGLFEYLIVECTEGWMPKFIGLFVYCQLQLWGGAPFPLILAAFGSCNRLQLFLISQLMAAFTTSVITLSGSRYSEEFKIQSKCHSYIIFNAKYLLVLVSILPNL